MNAGAYRFAVIQMSTLFRPTLSFARQWPWFSSGGQCLACCPFSVIRAAAGLWQWSLTGTGHSLMPHCDITAGYYYGQLITSAHASCHWPAAVRFTELDTVAGYRPAIRLTKSKARPRC